MIVELSRFCSDKDVGTFGRLTVRSIPRATPSFSCFTVEKPWLNNTPMTSCVPSGVYAIRPQYFHRGGYPAYELVDVPGRSNILVHVGNTQGDVAGCIAPGRALGFVDGAWAVTGSRATLDRLLTLWAGLEHTLVITGP